MKRFLKIIRNTVLSLLALLVLLVVLIQLSVVQNFLTHRAAAMLSKKLKTEVQVRNVRIDFFNHLLLQGVLIKDQRGDTLLYTGEARVRITDWAFFRKEVPVIRYLGLHNADVHLYRTRQSPEWNYQFIADAFDTGPKDSTKAQNEFELDLETLDLQRIRFRMADAWVGNDQALQIGSLQLRADEVDLKKKRARIDRLFIEGGSYSIHDYAGGRPVDTTKKKAPSYVIDTTAFNPAHWSLFARQLELKNCGFSLEANDATPPPAGEFDAEHMGITQVDLSAGNVRINADTITGRMAHLTAHERSGVIIRHMEADVTVSPRISECKKLLLQTNNSTIGDYYAMRYNRFPDFTEYIDSVRMVAHLKDAQVDMQDVAFFAPPMKWMKRNAHLSGDFDGTVAAFHTQNLNVTDGESRLTGNLAMRGLPDIEKTFFSFENGGIFTTGPALLKWAPQLRNHPAVALEILRFAQFSGTFYGLYNSFLASGTLVSNLGTVVSDVEMTVPPLSGRNATYKGILKTTGLQIGPFLRIPNVGSITATLDVEGKGFDPLLAALKLKGNVARFEALGYPYKNILVDGTLERKKFTGTGQVNDSNVSMAFNGAVDFSGPKPVLNATANLLQSNWKALGFVKDSTLASADLNIATIGINPDDFIGKATLYNINVRRSGARLELDSIDLTSTLLGDSTSRKLVIASNALTAELTGKFLLTEVPAATQLFLSGYMPNYIPPPHKATALQNFTYSIFTHRIDPLLSVLVPQLRGFDSGTLYGFLKSAEHRLVMEANFPYARIGPIYLQNATVQANGDYEKILITSAVKRFATSDGLLNATLDMNALVGNDSLDFSITTQSPDAYGTAHIGGFAYAHGDTLSGYLRPSEFLLNGDRWEIAEGNAFAFAADYLVLQNIDIHSGEQKLLVNSGVENGKPLLTAILTQYDLSNLREISSLADYQSDGRVSGTVRLYEPLRESRHMEADLRGTNVAMGTDTLGNVRVAGSYDIARGRLMLQPETGIYRTNAALRISGTFDADSTRPVLNGQLVLDNAPLDWIAPFTVGSVSQLKGTIDGTVQVGGTPSFPITTGTLVLRNAAFQLDYTGVPYTIPTAIISVTKEAVSINSMGLYDALGGRAEVSGSMTHRNFGELRFALNASTPGMEVLRLLPHENAVYYGNLTAAAEISLRGTVDNMQLSVMRGVPTRKGNLYLPITSSSGTGTYSFVTFKAPADTKRQAAKTPMRFSLYLDAIANPLVEVSMILDPTTGDAINARGNGSIRLELPSGAAARLYGNLLFESGDYTFTLRQVAFQRKFNINSGSTISFSGPVSQTQLNVEGIYPTYARLYDLLDTRQIDALPPAERTDAQARQKVDLLLRMKGSLTQPVFSFDVNLPEGHSTGTVAETELRRIRQNERELFDQVASLLLIGSFVPTQGIASSTASRSVINNVSEMLSSNVSGQLTNIISKLTGDSKLALDLRYKSYDLADGTGDGSTTGRNEVKLGLRRNFFNNRLVAEVGSAYDWGRPVGNANRSNFNPVGDFRLQYLLKEDGHLRLNVFHTSNFDVLLNDNISRSGAGITYRRSFDHIVPFFFPWVNEPAIYTLPDSVLRRAAPAVDTTRKTAVNG